MALPPYPGWTPSTIDFTSGTALYIASVAAEIPPAFPIADAIRDGLISQADATAAGLTSVSIAKESSTLFELASAAALSATARASVPATDIGTVLFVSGFPHARPPGHNVATALAETIGSPCVFATEIGGSCADGVNSVILAAYRLLFSSDRAALVVSGDIYPQPYVDRFNIELGLIFADGAAAVVLSGDGGYARLVSAATLTDPALSGVHADVSSDRTPIDFTARAQAFLETRMDTDEAFARIKSGLISTVDAALSTAGISIDDVAYALVPAVGQIFLQRNYLDSLNIPVSRTTWEYTAVTGHVGAADQFTALAHVVDNDLCRSGDYILLVGEGGGFQWSVMILQVQ